ncbi:nucleoside phosphorylase domain-containing protein [Hypoxylon trugodes]|uniref:nucleoside phosphorylase domain-containing protein n=1 Tax=Hypoxylon trugodes TaxID=326681 RepID=UPI0021978A91|nr:nucleoside phosphorylase domain-containing protein [Hypoxylon trugodes]KAI1387859.1 nucleoside phosphorylase domain-containing protein [Hypoxylon trugodes]
MEKLFEDNYTVGWVAIVGPEIAAAKLLLDDEHERIAVARGDDNGYILGEISGHNIVLAFPPSKVGVGGGVPKPPNWTNPRLDIRLGDVVVGKPEGSHSGVCQFDMGKRVGLNQLDIKYHLNRPPNFLLTSVETLRLDQAFNGGEMRRYIEDAIEKAKDLERLENPEFPGRNKDQLFQSTYSDECQNDLPAYQLGQTKTPTAPLTVERKDRKNNHPSVHYGLIGSGNQVIRSASFRDMLRDTHNILCFEMESAGLMNNFPCLVIRGICDYSDSHKTKVWQPYAAITAAAYAKDLLRVIGPYKVKEERVLVELVQQLRLEFQRKID